MPHITLPAEWAPQSGIMLTWPHKHSDWQPWLSQVEPVFADIAYHSAERQRVLISCYDQTHLAHVESCLRMRKAKLSNIDLRIVESNDTWARDHGPITIQQDDTAKLLDFGFNGWGDKYDSDLDNLISEKLYQQHAFADLAFESIDLVLEGGSIESDGQGTLLTTSQCLLTPSRNPGLTQTQIEQKLKQTLGIEHFLWLHHGYLSGDDTDSHIDTLARFCDPSTICYVQCNDKNDEHFVELQAMEAELSQLKTAQGQAYNLVALPMVGAKHNDDGERLPATYANFLIINGAVLAPSYQDPADKLALAQLAQCFPNHEIIAIDCLPLVYQYGSLHCVTMQLPFGVLAS